MSEFLETLKARAADSQRRLQISQARLQQAQGEHAVVLQEHTSWMNAISAETRREQIEEQMRQARRPVNQFQPAEEGTPLAPTPPEPLNIPAAEPAAEINKTKLIRDVLQQNPTGIKPVGVWLQVKDHVARPYVYSVLSRMKEKRQVVERRGKYFLQITSKMAEASETGTEK